jgi:hypothetical protein
VPPATARQEAAVAAATPPDGEPMPAVAPERGSRASVVEPEVPLQVLIPRRIRTQLGIKAAQEGRSLRELVLHAIRGLGIEVSDADIRGKRGRRNS